MHLNTLEETVRHIQQASAQSPEAGGAPAQPGKSWSAGEILAHLRACADLWTFSIYAMLEQQDPALPDFDPRRWAKVTRYASLDFQTSFQAFALQRGELLRVLRNLPPEAWERAGLLGGRRATVFSQARRMALHELEHYVQIEAALSNPAG